MRESRTTQQIQQQHTAETVAATLQRRSECQTLSHLCYVDYSEHFGNRNMLLVRLRLAQSQVWVQRGCQMTQTSTLTQRHASVPPAGVLPQSKY